MSFYADTSLLISYYISDSNSSAAQTAIHATIEPFAVHRTAPPGNEERPRLGVFRQVLTPVQVSAAWSDVEADCEAVDW